MFELLRKMIKFQDTFKQVSEGFFSPVILFYGISLGAGMTIFASVFLLFPLTERITNAKQVNKTSINNNKHLFKIRNIKRTTSNS